MTTQTGYRKTFGTFSATMIIAGSMIGSGIFIVPAEMVRTGGTGSFLVLAWVFATVVTLLGANAYGELAGMFPRAGGQYAYLREAYGPFTGFLYGWTAFTIIQSGIIAAVAMAFAKYLGRLFPAVSETAFLAGPLQVPALHVGTRVTIGPYAFGLTPARLCAIGLILGLSLVNLFGARLGARIQNTFTVAKLGALGALILAGLLAAAPQVPHLAVVPQGADAALPFVAALLVVQTGSLFSADCWNAVTFIAAEMRQPKRSIPLALLIGPLTVMAMYLLANAAYLRILGPAGIAGAPSDRVGSQLLGAVMGPRGDLLMTLAILVSTFGCNNGLILSGSRLYQAMAEDGLFFRRAVALNRHGVPGASIAMQALWASVLTLTGSYSQLLEFTIFAALLFYVLTVGGVFVLRIARPGAERPVRAFGYPVLPALYLAGALAVMGALLAYRPSFTWPGLVLVALGGPVYLLAGHRRGAKVPQPEGDL
jgi:APA family basic amino acid/polyamine antiporter